MSQQSRSALLKQYGRHQARWVPYFIRVFTNPDEPITLEEGKSELIRPHDLFPLIQSPTFLLPSELKACFPPNYPH